MSLCTSAFRSATIGSHAIILVLLSACQTAPTSRPIYGSDDRTELIEANQAQCQIGAATMAVLPRSSLRRSPTGQWHFTRTSRLQDAGWCSTERFSRQQSQAHCTAFLISQERIATAGHCINADDDPAGPGLNCADAVFLFDYKLGIDGQLPVVFESTSIFTCATVVAGVDSAIGVDWRVVSLNTTTSRQPLELYIGKPIPIGTPLEVIGHPQGLPMKLMSSASLIDRPSINEFVADFDTFSGSSGSPIVIAGRQQPLVVGLVSGGDADYVEGKGTEQCKTSVFCASSGDCEGEHATVSAVLAPYATRTQRSIRNPGKRALNTESCAWCSDPLRSRHWQCDITDEGIG